MNKILTIGTFCLISVTSFASPQLEKGINDSSCTWYLKSGQDSLAWVDGFSAVNSTVEFDLLPQIHRHRWVYCSVM